MEIILSLYLDNQKRYKAIKNKNPPLKVLIINLKLPKFSKTVLIINQITDFRNFQGSYY